MKREPKMSKLDRLHQRELKRANKRTTGMPSGNAHDRRKVRRAEHGNRIAIPSAG